MHALLLITFMTMGAALAAAQSPERLFFKGHMTQKSPLQWEGPFVLYLQLDPERNPPQPISGFIQWPTLGDAKTKLTGTRLSDSKFEFTEIECVSGDCTKIILGGRYSATASTSLESMKGMAEGMLGLAGTFRLERIRPEDWR